MLSLLITIIVGVAVLGFLVFIHEAGHFFAAKFFGVKVEEFGFGFPFPGKIWSTKRGETEYSINWLPAGGFVRLYGEESGANEKDPRSFSGKSVWVRIAIAGAGVVVNLVFAVLLFTILLATSGFKQDFDLQIPNHFPFGHQTDYAMVMSIDPDTAASQAGLKEGDKVVSINGTNLSLVKDVNAYIGKKAGQEVTLSVEGQDGKKRDLKINSLGSDFVLISGVVSNSPAEKAGFKKGDKILAVNGHDFTDQTELSKYIQENAGKSLSITVQNLNESSSRTLTVTPRKDPPKNQGALGIVLQKVDLLPGAFLSQEATISYNSLPEKVFSGVLHSGNMIEYEWVGLKTLFGKSVAEKSITPIASQSSGPIGIVAILGAVVQNAGPQALRALLTLVAFISLILGVANVLPIPAMDGGRLFFFYVEAIRGKKVSAKVENMIHGVGFMVLIVLFLLITFNDVVKIFTGKLFG